jgi:hypothetical protein
MELMNSIPVLAWTKVRDGWEYAKIKGHSARLHVTLVPSGHYELWQTEPVIHVGTYATMDEAKEL